MSCETEQTGCSPTALYIGCFGNCEVIEMLYNAKQTGVHTVVYSYEGQVNQEVLNGVIDEPLVVPNIFADIGHSTFSIINPDGSDFTIIKDNVEYKYFKIKMSPSYNVESEQFVNVTDNPFTNELKDKLDNLTGGESGLHENRVPAGYQGTQKPLTDGTYINQKAVSQFNEGLVFYTWDGVDTWDVDFFDEHTIPESEANIKTKYENNANTNAFTDDEQTKLAVLEGPSIVTLVGHGLTLGERTIPEPHYFNGTTYIAANTNSINNVPTLYIINAIDADNLEFKHSGFHDCAHGLDDGTYYLQSDGSWELTPDDIVCKLWTIQNGKLNLHDNWVMEEEPANPAGGISLNGSVLTHISSDNSPSSQDLGPLINGIVAALIAGIVETQVINLIVDPFGVNVSVGWSDSHFRVPTHMHAWKLKEVTLQTLSGVGVASFDVRKVSTTVVSDTVNYVGKTLTLDETVSVGNLIRIYTTSVSGVTSGFTATLTFKSS